VNYTLADMNGFNVRGGGNGIGVGLSRGGGGGGEDSLLVQQYPQQNVQNTDNVIYPTTE